MSFFFLLSSVISVVRWQSEAKFQNIHPFRLKDMNSKWVKTSRNTPAGNSKNALMVSERNESFQEFRGFDSEFLTPRCAEAL